MPRAGIHRTRNASRILWQPSVNTCSEFTARASADGFIVPLGHSCTPTDGVQIFAIMYSRPVLPRSRSSNVALDTAFSNVGAFHTRSKGHIRVHSHVPYVYPSHGRCVERSVTCAPAIRRSCSTRCDSEKGAFLRMSGNSISKLQKTTVLGCPRKHSCGISPSRYQWGPSAELHSAYIVLTSIQIPLSQLRLPNTNDQYCQ